MSLTDSTWTPSSWRSRAAAQQPDWPDPDALAAVRDRLQGLPPLVFAGEARALLVALGEVCEGRAFLLQAGDCVESFHDVSAPAIRERLKVLLQMSAVLTYAATLPVVRVGRIAGQFAKPRTSPTEVVDGVELPSFRGHIVHSDEPTPEARIPDPERLVQGYYQSVSTLNLLRAFTKGGSPISPTSTTGTASSSRRRPPGDGTRRSPTRSSARCGSCRRSGSTSEASGRSTRSTSGRVTRACCSTTRSR